MKTLSLSADLEINNSPAYNYDISGDYLNPSSWFNGTEYSALSWSQGRRLASLKVGGQTCSYAYDMSGLRSVKVADGLRHEYVTQNRKVMRDTVTNAASGAFAYCANEWCG